MRFQGLILNIFALFLITILISCTQQGAVDSESIDGDSQQTEAQQFGDGDGDIDSQQGESKSEKVLITNYAIRANLNPEITWAKWSEFKAAQQTPIELGSGFTYNTETLAALVKFFTLSDLSYAFLYNALFSQQMNLTIVAQYTFYTFATANAANAQQQQGTQSAGLKINRNGQTEARGFQAAFSTFTNALAIFSRITIENFRVLDLDVKAIDYTSSSPTEFASYNTGTLEATAIERKMDGIDYTFGQYLNKELEYVFRSSVVVADSIEYTFIDYATSGFTFKSISSADFAFAPPAAIEKIAMTCPHCFGVARSQQNAVTVQQQANIVSQNRNTAVSQQNIESNYKVNEAPQTTAQQQNNVIHQATTTMGVRLLLDSTSSNYTLNANIENEGRGAQQRQQIIEQSRTIKIEKNEDQGDGDGDGDGDGEAQNTLQLLR